jgi:hypothetical protein
MSNESGSGKIAAWIIIALVVGVGAGYAYGNGRATTQPTDQHIMAGIEGTAKTSDSQLALRQGMRKLWTDHVVWTREYISSAISGAPDTQAVAGRLLKNQEDIGAAIVPYYGQAAGDKLTSLLKEHILIAVDLVDAAKTNNQTKFKDSDARWTKNADDIASFLSQANPNWPKDALVAAMAMHLDTTKDEAVTRLGKDWAGNVKAFDTVYDHILKMSDMLSDGIVKQFPDKF